MQHHFIGRVQHFRYTVLQITELERTLNQTALNGPNAVKHAKKAKNCVVNSYSDYSS